MLHVKGILKRIIIIIILLVLLIILAVVIPWREFININSDDKPSLLKIYPLKGDIDIFIDDEFKGTVFESDVYGEFFPLKNGYHKVKIEKNSNKEFYTFFEKEIWFEGGFDTVISWELGPTYESSSGWILYSKKGSDDKKTILNLVCEPKNCDILVNEEKLNSPINSYEINRDNQYHIKASYPSYYPLEFNLLPEDNVLREELEGYELFVEVKLYQYPL